MPAGAAEPAKAEVTPARPQTADAGAALDGPALDGPTRAEAAPAGSVKAGSVKAGSVKAGSEEAGSVKAGSEEAGSAAATADAGPAKDSGAAKDSHSAETAAPGKDSEPVKEVEPPRSSAPEQPTMQQPATPSRPRWRLPRRGSHALRRLPPPRKMVAAAARNTAAWARGPIGRLTLPGLFIATLIALTGTAGAYLVPATAAQTEAATNPKVGAPGSSASASAPTGEVPGTTLPGTANPSAPTGGATPGTGTSRPADALRGWAEPLVTKMDIPEVALQAYGYAELVLGQTRPACKLSWTTLAAIGKVESNHGRANNATLLADGRVLPVIIGPVLDGTNGRAKIPDTDAGALDNDIAWDHAVGPMQFIPATWRNQAADADGDGIRDPNDIDDASLAAANYLCSDGRDLSTAGDWWAAILAYNDVRPYANAVFTAANNYGVGSRG